MFANTFGNHRNVECGLVCIIRPPDDKYDPIKTSPIPLQSVSIQASIVHAVAQVELTQVYVNKEEQPIEAVYYFPVDSNAGVTHFHAELEGKTIKGVVKPEEEAKEQYEKAVQEKKSAFLVESNKPDIFKVRVGYLKPGSQVKIVIGYVTEVKNEKGSNALRFFIPTTVSPRYIPNTETDEKALDLKNMKFAVNTPAPITITVDASIQGEIKSVESPTHSIKVTSKGPVLDKPSWEKAVVELVGKTSDMDRDFVLNIIPKEPHTPHLYQEKGEDSTVLMAHFIPSFNLDEQKVELIFVLDRSGSMQGQSIGLAKKALQLFLHSLPVDCYFNIVGFGSSFQFLFPESVKYDDGSLKKALLHAEKLDADLGGTEILQPLKEVFNKTAIGGYLRQVFIITDGEVSNTEQVIGFISANAHISRVFSLGIGDGASHELVEGLATAGGGTSAFATYNETINSKVLQQLKHAIQPSLTDVSVSWAGFEEPAGVPSKEAEINKEKTLLGYGKPISSAGSGIVVPEFTQVPEKVPPIFDGSQLLVFGIFKDRLPSEVCIKAESPDGPLSITIPVEINEQQDLGSTGMLHKLASTKLVNELQLKLSRISYINYTSSGQNISDEETTSLKAEIIKIACKEGIASKFTSFIAVDAESNQKSEENWVLQTRYVPSQLSHGWHGGMNMNSMAAGVPLKFGSKSMVKSKARCRRAAPANFNNSCGPVFSGMMRKSARVARGTAAASTLGFCTSVADDEGDSEQECFEEFMPSSPKNLEAITDADRLHILITMQSFDGSFPLNENFSEALRTSLVTLQNDAKKKGWDEKIYATALALSYLSEKFQTLQDSWELVALKATKWLQKNAGINFAAITADAQVYIKSI